MINLPLEILDNADELLVGGDVVVDLLVEFGDQDLLRLVLLELKALLVDDVVLLSALRLKSGDLVHEIMLMCLKIILLLLYKLQLRGHLMALQFIPS